MIDGDYWSMKMIFDQLINDHHQTNTKTQELHLQHNNQPLKWLHFLLFMIKLIIGFSPTAKSTRATLSMPCHLFSFWLQTTATAAVTTAMDNSKCMRLLPMFNNNLIGSMQTRKLTERGWSSNSTGLCWINSCMEGLCNTIMQNSDKVTSKQQQSGRMQRWRQWTICQHMQQQQQWIQNRKQEKCCGSMKDRKQESCCGTYKTLQQDQWELVSLILEHS